MALPGQLCGGPAETWMAPAMPVLVCRPGDGPVCDHGLHSCRQAGPPAVPSRPLPEALGTESGEELGERCSIPSAPDRKPAWRDSLPGVCACALCVSDFHLKRPITGEYAHQES